MALPFQASSRFQCLRLESLRSGLDMLRNCLRNLLRETLGALLDSLHLLAHLRAKFLQGFGNLLLDHRPGFAEYLL